MAKKHACGGWEHKIMITVPTADCFSVGCSSMELSTRKNTLNPPFLICQVSHQLSVVPAKSWPYTEQNRCLQLLLATMLPALRLSVYSQTTIAGNTQLHNYNIPIMHEATLLLATVLATKLLCVWPA